MESPLVFEATAQNFQLEVMERSRTVPVLIDFWADWCGPCKTLSPVLDRVVDEFSGGFVLAKVDADKEQELGQAFQVQSIPICILMIDGRPVDAFTGALPEDQVKEFLARHKIEPAGDAEAAAEPDPDSPEARLAAARDAARRGDADAVREALAGFPEDSELAGDRDNLIAGMGFLEAELTGPEPAAELMRGAREHFLASRIEDALQAILASAEADRGYGGGLARQAMLFLQGALGPTDAVDEYRRRLATVLF